MREERRREVSTHRVYMITPQAHLWKWETNFTQCNLHFQLAMVAMYQWFSSETHSHTTCWTLFLGMGLTCPPPCHSLGHHAQRVSSASQEPGNLGYQVVLQVVYVWVCEERRGRGRARERKKRGRQERKDTSLGYCSILRGGTLVQWDGEPRIWNC